MSTTQSSYRAVADVADSVLSAAGPGAADLGEQLFAVVDALDASGSLRRALTDPARSAQDKAGLVSSLLRGRVDDRVVEVVQALAGLRWAGEAELVEAVERTAASAMLAGAEAEGALERVEDELFRLDRILVGARELRQAMSDRRADPSARRTLVQRLIGGKVHPVTQRLVERVAGTPRGRSLPASLRLLSDAVAVRRRLLLAEVTAAAPLGPDQVVRLEQLLARAYGRPVKAQVAVDPTVIGGLRVVVGSEVVDGTVIARLDDARRRLAG